MNLTRPQQLIYDSEKIIGGSIAVMCGIVTVDKVYPEAQVVDAIHKIYETNDALNYKLDDSGKEPKMYYESPSERTVNIVRVSQLSELDEIGQKNALTPFDLGGWLSELSAVFYPTGYGIIIKVHHLLGDAWSMSLIANQLNAILEGTPWVRYSYEKYIDSEKEYLESKKHNRDKAFFLDAFKQNNEPLLFSDKQAESYHSEKLVFGLSAQLRASLNKYAENTENSEFVCLFGAFAVLYGKLKNCAESFYLGMPVLNRTSEAELNTVGMYINNVPVPIYLDYEKSFDENLEEIQDSVFSVFKHQKFNYNDILKLLSEEYGFRGKLYDCTINYQPDELFSNQKIRSKDYWRGKQTENIQLFFQHRDREDGLVVEYTFRDDIISAEEIHRLHSMFMCLLNSVLINGQQSLNDIQILSDSEKERILHIFNASSVAYDKAKNVYELFSEQTGTNPNYTAIVAADRSLTYAKLKDEASRLAKGLVENGIKKGDIVAFCLPRDSRLLVAMLGILQASAVYLPLDPNQPDERKEYILKDSGAKLCISEENYSSLLKEEKLSSSLSVNGDDLCYCIYTSGSTGEPKGTLITHKNVLNYISCGNQGIYGGCIAAECKCILSLTSVSFDIFVTESLLPLANGKTIILANERQSQFGKELQNLLKSSQVDVMQTTPSKLRALMRDMDDTGCMKGIQSILLGGEAMDLSFLRRVKAVTDAKVFNVYGPTETTVWSSFAEVGNDEDISIGKPISNTQIYIVDRFLSPMPIGVTGELCIAGDGVCAGYLNRPELTEEKFVDNPFGKGKLYKTGDLAYWSDDGNIVFVGRNDFQIKINGQRVELGEIESALSSVDGIDSCVVLVRNDDASKQIICAFYTGMEIPASELRAILGKTLPRYMVPQSFTHLDSIPLSTSGKIDRNALLKLDIHSLEENEYIQPQTKEEKLLISTAKQLLKPERIGMLDNFFDLGGDSLKAIAWISLLEQNGYTLLPNDIFSCVNMAELKEKLIITAKKDYKEPIYPDFLPLTSAQKEVYAAQSIVPDKPVYNIPYFIKVQSLDAKKLQYATDCMLTRHEILRTRFEAKDGMLLQTIDEDAYCQVEKIEGNINDFVRPFDLSKAPLIRVGYKDDIVVFDFHHLVADGSSMPLFFKELNDYYMGRKPDKAVVPYKYFAVTQEDSAEDKAYWDAQFADEPPSLSLRADNSRTGERSYDGKSLFHHVSKDVSDQISSFCKAHGITPFVYYYGAFQILLQKYTMQEDIVVGTPVSRRSTKNIDTIGMFVHTLPLRCKPEGEKTVKHFLNEVREMSLSSMQHTDVSCNEIAIAKGKRTLFDAIFTYQTEEMISLQFADAPAQILETPLSVSKYEIEFSLYPRQSEHVLVATYDTALFREETMQKMMLAYERILVEVLDAEKKICDISILEESEKEKLLHTFNATTAPYDKTKSVYDLFSEQIKKNTHAYIKDESREYTFKQLDEDASKIDSYIRKTVGTKKQVIGVICDRGYEELTAIFGIVRGGNAYMPISAQYPKDRIKTMLETSGCKLVLTQSKYKDLADFTENIEDILNSNPESIPDPEAKPEDTLYVIYTSGSTGTPKGAMVSNKSAINRIGWMYDKYFDSSTVVMLKTPYTFDVSVWEIFGFAMYGFSLYILPEEAHYNQNEVLNHIKKGQVTHLHFVPSVFEQFLSVIKQSPDASTKLESLRGVILSGESLLAKDVNNFGKCLNQEIKIHNLYGPAECAVDVTSYDCMETETDPIPIGKPIANTQIYIVDKYMKPLPIGVVGELCIAGDNVGQGYLNRPKLTKEKFIDNPFGDGKLYKTGDLAYWREDGNIIFVGRTDFQIKINGQRIELGEIESAISSIEGIDSVAVIVCKEEKNNQTLCAFFTGAEIPAPELRALVNKTLPRYMVPQSFTHLDSMPLNASGKIDRTALSSLEHTSVEASEYTAPQTPVEETVCELFQSVLGVERIGRNDNFYDFGGTSLQLVQLLSYPPLNTLSASDFLTDPTPVGVSKILDKKGKNSYTFLVPLYAPKHSNKAIVLFPFAGGDASAYTALVAKAREEESNISLFFVDWPQDDDITLIEDEIRSLSAKMNTYFYSHCAGSVIAMKLLDRLNQSGSHFVQGYMAGASIPPRKALSGVNIWKHMSNKRIAKALNKAGLGLDTTDIHFLDNRLDNFRSQTLLFTEYFRNKKEKTDVCVTPIVSKKDPLTPDYKNAQKRWLEVANDINDVFYLDTPSHYFQTTDAEFLLKIFSNI